MLCEMESDGFYASIHPIHGYPKINMGVPSTLSPYSFASILVVDDETLKCACG